MNADMKRSRQKGQRVTFYFYFIFETKNNLLCVKENKRKNHFYLVPINQINVATF